MNKLLLITAFAFILGGCNNPLEKSVFEPLTIEELKVEMSKDSIFAEVYSNIREYLINERTDVEIAKYNDITYKRVMDYVYYEEGSKREKEIELFKSEWKEKNDKFEDKFDSVFNGSTWNLEILKEWHNDYEEDSTIRRKILSFIKMDYFDEEYEFVQKKKDSLMMTFDKLLYEFLESIK